MVIRDELIQDLRNYEKSKEKQLLSQFMELKVAPQDEPLLNEVLENEMKTAFQNIMIKEKTEDLCSLLNLLWLSLKNPIIKITVLITILDSVLECVGIADLREVLNIIRSKIGDQVNSSVEHHLLRIINTLLKRISKTTDFQIRGELHLTITRILNFCHESGFDYRSNIVQTQDKVIVEDSFLENFEPTNISSEFYENFWELQKYFNNLQEMNTNLGHGVSTPAKEDTKMTPIKLKRIEYILEDTIKYFKINPPIENKSFDNFPIKFLKLPNLLALQLQDSYFRSIIIVQTLFFCSSMKVFPAKNPIEVSSESKETLKRIEKKASEYLDELSNLRNDSNSLISIVNSFVSNENFWIQLKDNWKEKKKTFFKITKLKDSENDKQDSEALVSAAPAESDKTLKKILTISETKEKCRKEINKKIDIKSDFIEKFLSEAGAPTLRKTPINPSFSYYYEQARMCLNTFDEDEQCQTEFYSRAEYNLFEWKAFRSLERERIVKNKDLDREGSKFVDYKLLDFVKRNESFLEPEPRKRVKPNEEDEENGE